MIRRAKAILLEVKGKGDIEDPDVVVKGSVSVQLEAKGETIQVHINLVGEEVAKVKTTQVHANLVVEKVAKGKTTQVHVNLVGEKVGLKESQIAQVEMAGNCQIALREADRLETGGAKIVTAITEPKIIP